MSREIRFDTSQNVEIHWRVASYGQRLAAFLIDLFVIFAYIYVVTQVLELFSEDNSLSYIIFLPVMTYSLIFELLMEGQSLGKAALSLRVVHTDGGAPAPVQYFIRWVFRIIDIWFMTGIPATVFILMSSKGQRMGDHAANTTVVSLRGRPRTLGTVYRDVGEAVEPLFPQAMLPDEEQITTIGKVLDFNKASPSGKAEEMLKKARQAIEHKTGVKLPHGWSDKDYLNKLIEDYNYYEQML